MLNPPKHRTWGFTDLPLRPPQALLLEEAAQRQKQSRPLPSPQPYTDPPALTRSCSWGQPENRKKWSQAALLPPPLPQSISPLGHLVKSETTLLLVLLVQTLFGGLLREKGRAKIKARKEGREQSDVGPDVTFRSPSVPGGDWHSGLLLAHLLPSFPTGSLSPGPQRFQQQLPAGRQSGSFSQEPAGTR